MTTATAAMTAATAAIAGRGLADLPGWMPERMALALASPGLELAANRDH